LDEISKGRTANHGKPFRLLMIGGETIVLPPHFAHTIRNDSRFSLHKFTFNVDESGLCSPESVVLTTYRTFMPICRDFNLLASPMRNLNWCRECLGMA
jgi:hypothetical protein